MLSYSEPHQGLLCDTEAGSCGMRKLKGICQAPEPVWSSGYSDYKKSLHNLKLGSGCCSVSLWISKPHLSFKKY